MIRALVLAVLTASPAAAEMLVAARTIPAETVLLASDLAMAPGQVAGAIEDPDLAIGRESRVALYAGRPIREGDIGAPAVIERNGIMVLVYSNSGLVITTEGRALERAGPGDVIRVMNLSSRNTVTAVIAPDGTGHVSN